MTTKTECLDLLKDEAIKVFETKRIAQQRMTELADQIDDIQKQLRAEDPSISVEDAYAKAVDNIGSKRLRKALVKKRQAYLHIAAMDRNIQHLDRFQYGQNSLLSFLHGKQSSVRGSKNGVWNTFLAQRIKLVTSKNGWLTKLRQAGPTVERDFTNVKNQAKIAAAIRKVKEGRENEIADPNMKIIAKTIVEKNENERLTLNSLGADISRRKDRIATTVHNPFNIKRMGFDKWKSFELARLDLKKTFGEKTSAEIDKEMENEYRNITTRLRPENMPDSISKFTEVKFPTKFAEKLARPRRFIYKDDDTSWLEHQNKVGGRTLAQSILHDSETAAKNAAFLKVFGPYPREAFEALKKIAGANRDKNPFKGRVDREFLDKLNTIWGHMDGSVGIPGKLTLARWGQNLRNFGTMTSLGMGIFRAFPDIANVTANLRYNGMNVGERFALPFIESAKRFTNKEDWKAFMEIMGTASTERIGGTFRFYGRTTDTILTAKWMRLAYKLFGYPYWDEHWETTDSLIQSSLLARHIEKSFKELPAELKNNLLQSDIGDKEWEIYRKHPSPLPKTKRLVIAPESADEASDEEILNYLGKEKATSQEIKDTRDKLWDNLMTHFVEAQKHVISHAGPAERAMLYGNAKPGTVAGEIRYMFGQFKGFMAAGFSRNFGRLMYASGTQADIIGMIELGATLIGYGIVGDITVNYLEGRTMPDYRKPSVLLNAIASSAAMWGDGFKTLVDKPSYKKIVEYAAGPTGSKIIRGGLDIYKIGEGVVKTAEGDYRGGKQSKRAILDLFAKNVPFSNLSFMYLIYKHWIYNKISNLIDPGSVEKSANYLQKVTGERTFF